MPANLRQTATFSSKAQSFPLGINRTGIDLLSRSLNKKFTSKGIAVEIVEKNKKI